MLYIKIENLTKKNILFYSLNPIKPGINILYLPHYPLYELERLQKNKKIRIIEFISDTTDDKLFCLDQSYSVLQTFERGSSTEKIDLGIQLVGAPLLWESTRGEGIGVLVVDTGIQSAHPDLVNNVKGGVNFIDRNKNDYVDVIGHGTLVSGIIGAEDNGIGVIGVAPKCNLYAAKVISNNGAGNPNSVKSAIDWAIENKDALGIHIINMSLGSSTPCDPVKAALIRARKAGLIVVCASGNSGNDKPANYPGKYAENGLCICVSAIDNNKQLAKFSNTGKDVISFAAPGVNIYSTYLNGTYATMSGTSFAAPIITGLCALIYSKHKNEFLNNPTPHTNLDIMIKHLKKIVIRDDNNFEDLKNNSFGWGIPQITKNNLSTLQICAECTDYNKCPHYGKPKVVFTPIESEEK